MLQHVEFIQPVFNLSQVPKLRLPEVLVCGRSNVGKSSFLNSICGRKKLALVSSTPGKTRSLNYFKVNDLFYLVDLPGYGYAQAGKAEIAKWEKLIQQYFAESQFINLVIHLIDSRHEPTKLDRDFQDLINHYSLERIIILTKSDKLKQSERSKAVQNINKHFQGYTLNENLFLHSSETGDGMKEIAKKILSGFVSE
jgi:GTP-binding protein